MRINPISPAILVSAGMLALISLAACAQGPTPQAQQPTTTGCYSGATEQAASRNPSCEGGGVAPVTPAR